MITASDFLKWAQVFHLKSGGGGGGNGDVYGPNVSVDSSVVLFNGTSGKVIKESEITVDDFGNMTLLGLIATGIIDIPNHEPNFSQVSPQGSDTTGDGSYWRPYGTAGFADSLNLGAISLIAGTYLETLISATQSDWIGEGQDVTIMSCPQITLDPLTWGMGINPSKVFKNLTFTNLQAGQILSIKALTPGAGYSGTPTVNITGDGSGAAAVAIIGYSINSISIVNPGSYSTIPTLTATLGTGLTATLNMGALTAHAITGGTLYSVGNKIVVQGGTLSTPGANAILNVDSVSGGVITGLSVYTEGSYTVLPVAPISDLPFYADCVAASTSAFGDAVIYANGPDGSNPGVGATLTNAGLVQPFFIDGINPSLNSRVLMKDFTNMDYNGIYTVTQIGGFAQPWILTRATDFDVPVKLVNFGSVNITGGVTQSDSLWELTSVRPVVIGSGDITFAEFFGTLATFSVDAWGVISAAVIAGGVNYETTSQAVFSGGGGVGGGKASLNLASTGGVKRYIVTSGGSLYTSATVTVTGTGTGATAQAIIAPSSGEIDLSLSSYIPGSFISLDSVNVLTDISVQNISKFQMVNSSVSSTLNIVDVSEIEISNWYLGVGQQQAALSITGQNSGSVPVMNIYLNNLDITSLTIENLSTTGMNVFVFNCPYLTFEGFSVIDVSMSKNISVTIDSVSFNEIIDLTEGGYNLTIKGFPNNTPNSLYVSPAPAGRDQTGDGGLVSPYATLSYAQSVLTNYVSATSPDTLTITGSLTDNGNCYVSPNINVFAVSADFALTSSNPITMDPAWNTSITGAANYSYWQNVAIHAEVNLDFSFGNINVYPFIQFIQTYFANTNTVFNGNPVASFAGMAVYLYDCYGFNFSVDNCYIYSNGNQWFGQTFFGNGTTTTSMNVSSFLDWFDDNLTITCKNPSTDISYYNFISTTVNGVLRINITGSATLNLPVLFQSCYVGSLYIYVDPSVSTGGVTVTLAGCNKIPITFDDQSVSGNLITLQTDSSSWIGTPNILNGTPNIVCSIDGSVIGLSNPKAARFTTANADALSVNSGGQFLDSQRPSSGIVASGTLTPAQLLGKIIILSPSTSINVDWGSAASLLAAMTNPVTDGTLDLIFVNRGTAQVTLTNTTDPTHIGVVALIGGASVIIPAQTIFICRITCSGISPASFAIFGGPSVAGSSPGAALLAASNIFTGAVNEFNTVNMAYSQVNGPSVITSVAGIAVSPGGPYTPNSFTLSASDAGSVVVQFNGSLTTQTAFLPLATDFETFLLGSFPGGSSIPTGTGFMLKLKNLSSTATVNLTSNTGFSVIGTISVPPNDSRDVWLVKATNTPTYEAY